MNIETIIKLLDAGYTKDEIKNMSSGSGDPEPGKKEPEKKEPEKKEPEKKEPEKKEPEKQDPEKQDPEKTEKNDDMLKLLVSKFEELTSAIQDSNIKSSNNKTPEQTAPEELLANIVKPTKK